MGYFREEDVSLENRGSRVRSNMNLIITNVTDGGTLERAYTMLANIPGGYEKAVRNAINRAAQRIESNSVSAVRERYAISYSEVKRNVHARISYNYSPGSAGEITAFVRFSGARIPLHRFDGARPALPSYDKHKTIQIDLDDSGKFRWIHPGLPAYGRVLKSSAPRKFPTAFVAWMTTGHTGIFQRTGSRTHSGKEAIKEYFGPAVPQMIGYEAVARKLIDKSLEGVTKDINHNVLAMLNGYWR